MREIIIEIHYRILKILKFDFFIVTESSVMKQLLNLTHVTHTVVLCGIDELSYVERVCDKPVHTAIYIHSSLIT